MAFVANEHRGRGAIGWREAFLRSAESHYEDAPIMRGVDSPEKARQLALSLARQARKEGFGVVVMDGTDGKENVVAAWKA